MLGTAFPAARCCSSSSPARGAGRAAPSRDFDHRVAHGAARPRADAAGIRVLAIRRPGRTPAAPTAGGGSPTAATGTSRCAGARFDAATPSCSTCRSTARAGDRRRRARLPRVHAQPARRVLRAARPAGRRARWPSSVPARCGSAATSAATGSPLTSSCCRPACSTAGCCPSRRRDVRGRRVEAGEVVGALLRGRIGAARRVAQAALPSPTTHLGAARQQVDGSRCSRQTARSPDGARSCHLARAARAARRAPCASSGSRRSRADLRQPGPNSYLAYRPANRAGPDGSRESADQCAPACSRRRRGSAAASAAISPSASARPTQDAPSTLLPGSSSL